MLEHTTDCKIPSEMVPYCPKCGGKMYVNLRKDSYFVRDSNWEVADQHYHQFVEKAVKGKLVLLELGIGFNTPGIIRYPFEQLTFEYSDITLVRMNTYNPDGPAENINKTISISEDMSQTIAALKENKELINIELVTKVF